MLGIEPDWSGGIDTLVEAANSRLQSLLPADRAARPKDEVNARLIRHYTTVGLLPLPQREGREARYGRRHLLQLLALRRLMADGLSGRSLYAALAGQEDAGLERLARHGVGAPEGAPEATSNVMAYVLGLKEKAGLGEGQTLTAPLPAFLKPPVAAPVGRSAGRGTPAPTTFRVAALSRVSPVPGLELTVGEGFSLPTSEEEWTQMLRQVRRSLIVVQRTVDEGEEARETHQREP